MKYIDDYRDAARAHEMLAALHRLTTRPWRLMEICAGQTQAIVKFGIDELLPREISLVHGPGCPVCVTPLEMIDRALAIAAHSGVIFCSFGDMLRVPGSTSDLFRVRAQGADVRIVYSPLDALQVARDNPDREVVFFAIGFETTAPANAMAVHVAKTEGLRNFSVLVSQVLVPPALETILSAPTHQIQGVLAAGHVCMVMGMGEYEPLAAKYRVPIVVTGFEPLDILQGIYMRVNQLETGRAQVENQYARTVQQDGNRRAIDLIDEIFSVIPRKWRGIDEIPQSGLGLCAKYADFDAECRFDVCVGPVEEASECISGQVLQGLRKPNECPAFGTSCHPGHPLGATMVSSEGACAAYHRYRPQREYS